MLSVRLKTIFIIIGIVLFITASTLTVGLVVSQFRVMGVVRATLLSVSGMASGMVSSETARIREEVAFIAGNVGRAGNDAIAVMEEQARRHRTYLSFSVVDFDGNGFHTGHPDARYTVSRTAPRYAPRAAAGETFVTSTVRTPAGDIVKQVWAPLDAGRAFAATLPGLYLSEFLSPYGIWEDSSIFVIDGSGTHVAGNRHHDRILRQRNYIEYGLEYFGYRRIGELHSLIIEHREQLIELFSFAGRRMFIASSQIPATDNWSVVVTAPLAESPVFHVREALVISAVIIIILGAIAAICAAQAIAGPYEKMAKLKRDAETASNFKTQFLANMSHEIRTPLNAIIGLSEMELGNTKLRGDSFASIEKIHSVGITMLGIINDLLDISKIESGRLSIVPVVYDVANMINDTIQLNIVRLGSKQVQFRLHVDGDVPVKLKGDELRVRQIFNNLLSNAFKYTEAGTVDWSISCTQEGGRAKITGTVTDTGLGIRDEDRDKLFKDYSQVNPEGSYLVEGTGLGLSITKKLVALMGGSVTLKSEYLKGSSFTVEFFQEWAGDDLIGKETAENLSQFRYSARRNAGNEKLVRSNMSYATVLVVDDFAINLDITRGLLKPYRINVDTVESGNEAVAKILKEEVRYDAIFMDHMMPGMNGIQAVKIIRDIDSVYAKNIPIIALTANAVAGSEAMYLRNGFQAFLPKPIDIFRLDQVLNRWVRNKDREDAMPQAGGTATDGKRHNIPFTKTVTGINIAQGLANMQDDRDSYLAVLKSFVRHTPTKLITIKAAGNDLASYRIAVHALKGSSRSIGAQALGDMAEKLEKAAAAGDLERINAGNTAFVQAAEKLVADIKVFLDDASDTGAEKPEREYPEPQVITAILEACENYDMEALRNSVGALAAFSYAADPGMAQWVEEQSHLSNFDAIRKRLAPLAGKA